MFTRHTHYNNIRGGQYERITEPLPVGVTAAAVPGGGTLRCTAHTRADSRKTEHVLPVYFVYCTDSTHTMPCVTRGVADRGSAGGLSIKERTTEQTYPNGTRTAQIRAHTAPSHRYTNQSPPSSPLHKHAATHTGLKLCHTETTTRFFCVRRMRGSPLIFGYLLLAAVSMAHEQEPVPSDTAAAASHEPSSAAASSLPPKKEASSSSAPASSAAVPAMKPLVALRAARPWSFTATVGPVALGTALAFKIEDAFNGPLLLLTPPHHAGVHAAGNLINTLVDYTKGLDTPGSSDLTLVKGELLPRQVKKLISGCYGLAAAAAAPLCAFSRAPFSLLSSLFAAGAGSAFVYTGGPGLKYKALGDILISATFGPLLVAFAYATQAGSVGWQAMLGALPITLHIEAILHANNARDVEEDLASGVKTLAARLGPDRSYKFYAALLGLPYLAPLYLGLRHSSLALLPLITLPAARKLSSSFRDGKNGGSPSARPNSSSDSRALCAERPPAIAFPLLNCLDGRTIHRLSIQMNVIPWIDASVISIAVRGDS